MFADGKRRVEVAEQTASLERAEGGKHGWEGAANVGCTRGNGGKGGFYRRGTGNRCARLDEIYGKGKGGSCEGLVATMPLKTQEYHESASSATSHCVSRTFAGTEVVPGEPVVE
jgi:hypothetical protein